MKTKRLFLILFPFFLFLVSCGKTRPSILPRYQFTPEKTLSYHLNGDLNLGVNAGLFQFNGNIQINADLSFKAESTNSPYGTFLRVTIKNAKVSGVSGKIKAVVMTYINYIRILFSGIYITPEGKTIVLYKNQPHAGLSSYAQMIFPDFSDMNLLWRGKTLETNFNGRFQKEAVTITVDVDTSVASISSPNLFIRDQIEIDTFDQKEFAKSSDPQAWGNFNAVIDSTFNYIEGLLSEKKGEFNFDMRLPVKQGFLSYIIALQGNGNLSMQLMETAL